MAEDQEGRKAAAGAAEAVVAGLGKLGEHALAGAQRGAPIEEGTLRGSGQLDYIVNGVRFQGASGEAAARGAAKRAAMSGMPVIAEVEISFSTPYAARQHEETDWEHPRGGHAKYLEREIAAVAPRVVPVLEAAKLTGAAGTFPG